MGKLARTPTNVGHGVGKRGRTFEQAAQSTAHARDSYVDNEEATVGCKHAHNARHVIAGFFTFVALISDIAFEGDKQSRDYRIRHMQLDSIPEVQLLERRELRESVVQILSQFSHLTTFAISNGISVPRARIQLMQVISGVDAHSRAPPPPPSPASEPLATAIP